MNMLRIRLFATLKDRVGAGAIAVSVPLPASVEAVLAAVVEAYPVLEASLPTVVVAVNKQFVRPDMMIKMGDEVALFPPVSGGEEWPHPTFFAVMDGVLDLNLVQARLVGPDVGAIGSFTGYVRGETTRKGLPAKTLYLEYEAYEEMARERMGQIAYEIWERWPLVKGVAIVQRVGQLAVGDVTTFVACAAGHRDQGVFEAARYGIDRLKEIVPIWKKEMGEDRQVWVEGHYRPSVADNRQE